MSEYYIPDISELYVGFEYQSMCIENAHWGICKVEEDFATPPYLYEIENETIRVKYLDIGDIESLGFSKETEKYKYGIVSNSELIKIEGKTIYKIQWYWHMDRSNRENLIRIYTGTLYNYPYTEIFRGDIKNKSELKKLLKQLNIL